MASSVHISLNVSNLDRSVDFYRRFLGEPREAQGRLRQIRRARSRKSIWPSSPARSAAPARSRTSASGSTLPKGSGALEERALRRAASRRRRRSAKPAATRCRRSSG